MKLKISILVFESNTSFEIIKATEIQFQELTHVRARITFIHIKINLFKKVMYVFPVFVNNFISYFSVFAKVDGTQMLF